MRSIKNLARRYAATCLVPVLVLAVAYPLYSQQPADLDPVRIHQIAGMLAANPAGFGVPCANRSAWTPKAAGLQGVVAEAETTLRTPLPPFDPEAYLAFSRTGEQAKMQKNLHSRLDGLTGLVLAECVEHKGRFLPRIAETMDSLAAMPSWTYSSHDKQLKNFHGVEFYVDLNAADMGDILGESLYLLGDQIPAVTRRHVLAEMDRHVFAPMRISYTKGTNTSADSAANWWLTGDMNWNAVCLKGVTGAALAVLPDKNDRALFVAGAEHYIDHYQRSFAPDGYDTEGLGYWNYGFAHFVELRENLFRVTHGQIDLFQAHSMKKVALFGSEWPMMPDNAAAYGDAHFMPKADLHLTALIEYIFQIPDTRDPLALDELPSAHHRPILSDFVLDLFPVEGDLLPAPAELAHGNPSTYYGDIGVLVSRPAPGQDFAVTIKAGGNTHHSHNDVGSWVLGMGASQPVGDPGGPYFYDAATFDSRRLESKLMGSFGHPVPEIGGHWQLDATKIKVNVIAHSLTPEADSISIDMTPAYDAPELAKLTRTLTHSREGKGSVVITDDFDLKKPTEIIESLPTHGTWKKVDANTVLFAFKERQVCVVVDGPVPVTFTETKVDEYGNSFTRVEAHLSLPGSGKVTVTLTPSK